MRADYNLETPEHPPWQSARKLPVTVSFREVKPPREMIRTREGTLWAYAGADVIIRGIFGEEYPCNKLVFAQTYEVIA